MRLPPPDFVLVGAPKCGTTAIYATLRQHPQLFLSDVKEPHYFAYDFPKRREVESIEDYDRLFGRAAPTQMRGEASALYLSSMEASSAILRRRPDAKFIALIRNPLDMFVSWHNECCKALDEEEEDPERAWMLQEERARGAWIPRLCREPRFLQYKDLCGLGRQIQALFEAVPACQRLVLLYDDLQQNPRFTYQQIVNFIGVTDDGRDRFIRENAFARQRSATLARLIRLAYVNSASKRLRLRLKPVLNACGVRPIGWLLRHNLQSTNKPKLSEPFRGKLAEAFSEDIRLLERLLGRNLTGLWNLGGVFIPEDVAAERCRGIPG